MIAFIWAQDEQGLIGKQGRLPWHLPTDLQHFKALTLNNAVVMGRKTFDGMNQRPLPNRMNIVMTNNPDYQCDDIQIVRTKEEVMQLEKSFDGTIFIIGGSQIFSHFIDEVDVLYRTVLHQMFDGDVYMSDIDYSQWELVDSKPGILDEKNTIPHTFEKYVRIK